MDKKRLELLWQQVQHTEGEIPWSVLDEFAEILAGEPVIWKSLAKRYNELALFREGYFGFEQLYIPAIFTKAAPNFNEEMKLEIAPFLVEKLCEAGFDDDDMLLEVFSAACGSVGALIIPTVIDFLYKEENTHGAWVFLWALLRLAKEADEPTRKKVIDVSVKFLEQAECGEISLSDADFAADVITHLECTEYLGLLKRLLKKSKNTMSYGEYKEAVRILSGKQIPYNLTEMWEEPVEEWLPVRWKRYKDWYGNYKSTEIEDEDFDIQHYQRDKLLWRFVRSVDVSMLSKSCYENAGFISGALFDYLQTYGAADIKEINENILRKVLLEIFPRKVTGDRELFETVAPIVSALLIWLESQGILSDGPQLAAKVSGWSDEIISESMDPANWGMGKSFAMKAEADGVDITDQELVQQYINQYNLEMLNQRAFNEFLPEGQSYDIEPPMPISEVPAKIGRNEPCPCGSGKKYKKCCWNISITG